MSNGRRHAGDYQPMKVVYISTQYVETDPRSFKTVVQQLTGKDSTVAEDQNQSDGGKLVSSSNGYRRAVGGVVGDGGGGGGGGGDGGGSGRSGLGSTTAFDGLMKDMPPVDELYKLFC